MSLYKVITVLLNIFPGPDIYQRFPQGYSRCSCDACYLEAVHRAESQRSEKASPEEVTGEQKRILRGRSSMCIGAGIAGSYGPSQKGE